MGAVHTATGSYAACTVTTYATSNPDSKPEQSLLDARRPPAQAKNKDGQMLLGNGKNFLYDTACFATLPGEDGCEQVECEFLQHVRRFAESEIARTVVAANEHLRVGIQLKIKADEAQYIDRVELCHISALKKTTAQCPDCPSRFVIKWDALGTKRDGLDERIRSRLSCHFRICTAAAGAELSGAFQKQRRSLGAQRSKARAERDGRTYHQGKGRGDRYDALQPYMETFEKSQLETIIESTCGKLGSKSRKRVLQECAKKMTITRHGKTVKGTYKKAIYTCRWVLDAGWSCGGICFGCKPGHLGELYTAKGEKKVREVPVDSCEDEEDNAAPV